MIIKTWDIHSSSRDVVLMTNKAWRIIVHGSLQMFNFNIHTFLHCLEGSWKKCYMSYPSKTYKITLTYTITSLLQCECLMIVWKIPKLLFPRQPNMMKHPVAFHKSSRVATQQQTNTLKGLLTTYIWWDKYGVREHGTVSHDQVLNRCFLIHNTVWGSVSVPTDSMPTSIS